MRCALICHAMLAVFVAGGPVLAAGLAVASEPAAPDSADLQRWAAHPRSPSPTEDLPSSVAPAGAEAARAADVFLIHPTTYLALRTDNARFDEPGEPRVRLEHGALRFQASVFNLCRRIYAPRYRQASVGAIVSTDGPALAATELAYADVRRAFDYYMTHENGGRPFLIGSHSQGSIHAIRLLRERVIGTPLASRLVAACVIGASLPRVIEERG